MRPAYLPTLLLTLFCCTCVPAQTLFTHARPWTGARPQLVDADLRPFYHGVASGDPLADRVIIWTRVTPDTLDGRSVTGQWRMATDPQLENSVREGTFTTDGESDYTVKVDVDGLAPGTTYYYGFSALDRNSLTGRTKTTPTGATADHLRFGVVSCSNYQAGYFNAYGRLAERNDLDAVIHLGDYIYEYANREYGNPEVWDERTVAPDREIVSLEDYRTRYSTYRLDSDLRSLHQQHPIISVWDDHESADNSYENGASNHQPGDEGSWANRKDRSRQAYFEWLPIRDTGNRSIYRTIPYGDLADLILLDTRLEGRDQQIEDVTDPALEAEGRTLLGEEQRAWFLEQLSSSTARYKLIGNQVIFSEFNIGWAGALFAQPYETVESGFLDIWDGYPAERRRVVERIESFGIDDVVILTGDFHTALAFEVAVPPTDVSFRQEGDLGRVPVYTPTAYDPETGAGAVAVEFATPSISAANYDEATGLAIAELLTERLTAELRPNDTLNLGVPNPHMKYANLSDHGYYVLDVRPDTIVADYFYSPILERSSTETFAAGFRKAAGSNHLEAAADPATGKVRSDVPAPADPPGLGTATYSAGGPTVLSVAPNPAREATRMSYSLPRGGAVTIDLLDAAGRRVRTLREGQQEAGLYTLAVGLSTLPAGTYYLRLTSPQATTLQPLVKR